MIGFEHIPANFYLLELGLIAQGSDTFDGGVSIIDVIWKNWIPVTLGNFVAGAFVVAGGCSFFFGRLGSKVDKLSLQNFMEARREEGYNVGVDQNGRADMSTMQSAK